MQIHKQTHLVRRLLCSDGYSIVTMRRDGKKREIPCQIPVDQFFSFPPQLHNGDVDNSVYAASSAQAADHVSPVKGSACPSSMSVDDIHDTVISRRCSTMAEVSKFAKSLSVPQAEDYADVVDNVVSEPAKTD